MIYNIQNLVYISLNVNGIDINLDGLTFDTFVIRDHCQYFVPTLQCTITDRAKIFDNNPIVEGSLITLIISRYKNSLVPATTFRVFRNTIKKDKDSKTYSLSCYMDLHDYVFNKIIKSYTGTSSSIVKQIASSNNLQSDIDTTNDSQVWKCSNMSQAHFIKHILLPAAYIDTSSTFLQAVSSYSNKLLFKNLNLINYNSPIKKLSDKPSDTKADLLIMEHKPDIKSGLNATTGGYGLTSQSYDITTGNITVNTGAVVNKNGNTNILLNKTLTGNVTKKIFSPINVGNSNPKYDTAIVQNRRLQSLYSYNLDVLINDDSTIDLFDPINISVSQGITAGSEDEISGSYFVYAKARIASSTGYYEKLCLTRNNINVSSSVLE
jgi:hypothetical protein